jgi:hypothetical protein
VKAARWALHSCGLIHLQSALLLGSKVLLMRDLRDVGDVRRTTRDAEAIPDAAALAPPLSVSSSLPLPPPHLLALPSALLPFLLFFLQLNLLLLLLPPQQHASETLKRTFRF